MLRPPATPPIIDDVRRDINADAYRKVADDFARELGGRGYGLYQYGAGRTPPLSDLDLVVAVPRSIDRSRAQRLRRDVERFRRRDSVRQYLIDDEIRICPGDLFEQINYVHPRIVADAFQILDGPAIVVREPEPTRIWSGVALLDLLLAALADFRAFGRSDAGAGPSAGLRHVLSALGKLPRLTFHDLERVGHAHRWIAGATIDEASALATAIAAVCANAVHRSADDGPDARAIESVVRRAIHLIQQAIAELSLAFMASVVFVQGPAPEARDLPATFPCRVPGLVAAHMWLHHAAADRPSGLSARLRDASQAPIGITSDPEYLALLAHRMRIVAELETWYTERALPGFPLCVAGLWHRAAACAPRAGWWTRILRPRWSLEKMRG